MIWSSKQLSEALGVKVDININAGQLQFNSKDVQTGDLFIALKGNGDGHNYARDAIKNGATAIIVSREVDGNIPQEKIILVDDTMAALNNLARYKRANSKAKFISITGSVGKTSTKEAMKLALQPFGEVFASRGNFNNFLGVPINLASMPDDIDYAIIEIGMSSEGEIRELNAHVIPDIAVITQIAPAHLEFFRTVEDIAIAKCEILESLAKDGFVITNADNEFLYLIQNRISKIKNHKLRTFSSIKPSDCQLIEYKIEDNNSIRVTYKLGTRIVCTELSAIPQYHAENFAACLEVVDILNLDINSALTNLRNFSLTEGRGKKIKAIKGDKEFELICDYYNSSPAALKASLSYLKSIVHPKKVAIIGDMRELGENSDKLHAEIAPYIEEAGVEKLLLVGEMVKNIADKLPSSIDSKIFIDVENLKENLDQELEGGELILIKASRSIGLDKLMDYFQSPSKARN